MFGEVCLVEYPCLVEYLLGGVYNVHAGGLIQSGGVWGRANILCSNVIANRTAKQCGTVQCSYKYIPRRCLLLSI